MRWECPAHCGYEVDYEDTCPECNLQLVVVLPTCDVSRLPPRRYAINFPWSQLVEIPAEGLRIGRGWPPLHGHDIARKYYQISGRHARFFWGADSELYIEDLNSGNGTYVNGNKLAAGCPTPVSPRHSVRLAEDVDIELLELNEYGEPL
jgi:hypothetical protein